MMDTSVAETPAPAPAAVVRAPAPVRCVAFHPRAAHLLAYGCGARTVLLELQFDPLAAEEFHSIHNGCAVTQVKERRQEKKKKKKMMMMMMMMMMKK